MAFPMERLCERVWVQMVFHKAELGPRTHNRTHKMSEQAMDEFGMFLTRGLGR
jgi:tRNA (Thr-GGU) A37 N-methylase